MINNLTQSNISNADQAGVFNEFVAPIVDDGRESNKDSIRTFLVIVLILTILLGIGAFLFTSLLSSQVVEKKKELASYDSSKPITDFETNLQDMRGLSQRLKLLNSVFDNKLYLSGMMFPVLESVVESNRDSYVYFDRFSIKKENTSQLSSVSLSGVALDYPTLYRQVNNFKEGEISKYITNFKLLSFSLDQDGGISFDVSFFIDISTNSFLKYVDKKVDELSISNSSGTKANTQNPGPLFKSVAPVKTVPTENIASSTAPKNNSTSSPAVYIN
ncbi:MAG: hypothetical protein RI945_352 [Candidatus Parcubacteria bacterium]